MKAQTIEIGLMLQRKFYKASHALINYKRTFASMSTQGLPDIVLSLSRYNLSRRGQEPHKKGSYSNKQQYRLNETKE